MGIHERFCLEKALPYQPYPASPSERRVRVPFVGGHRGGIVIPKPDLQFFGGSTFDIECEGQPL
jgi:hypothetical protein